MMVETQNEISISQDQSFLFQLTIRLLHHPSIHLLLFSGISFRLYLEIEGTGYRNGKRIYHH